MKVRVNNNFIDLEENPVLIALLKKLELDAKSGIAVAINAEVITKNQWAEFKLNENDEVIIITATQGG